MCGIAGVLNLDGSSPDAAVLQRMTDAIAHRGPDGEGHVVDGPVGLGHRRLAIIDLSDAAAQPMRSADGRFSITYNGEVFNFRELRVELERAGIPFRSRTDTEVVVNAFARWGPAALDRLNGMFAFAIWDHRERELFLARDRYGIKPLYYLRRENRFVFGSEVKALRAHPVFRADLDPAALVEYLTFQNVFTDRTIFEGVRTLPAGTWLKVRADGEEVRRRYWDFHFQEPDVAATEGEYLEELDRLVQQAVARQLVSDVDVGAYLSGGMDSGSITALAAERLPYMRTFTCGFDLNSASGLELSYDERAPAEYMSYLFKTEHYEMVLKAGDMERVLPRLTYHLEDLRVGQSYPNFYAAQLASKFVSVVLSGTGGDELFGGYPWRYYRAVLNSDFNSYTDKYYDFWQRLIPNGRASAIFAPIASRAREVDTRTIFRDVFAEHSNQLRSPEEYVNHSLYFEAKTFLNGLLIVEDKLSMAHGLETRVPLLDNDLVEFSMRLPVRYKLSGLRDLIELNENEPGDKTKRYHDKTNDGKLLLRRVMSRRIPNEVTDRVKQGFSGPDASWFKGESIDYVRRELMSGDAPLYDFLDRRTAMALVDEHLTGMHNHRLLIWSLLSLNQWCKIFLDGAAVEAAGPPHHEHVQHVEIG